MSEMSPLEVLLCSQVNFQNLEMIFPTVKQLPIYTIAKMQLDEAIRALSDTTEEGIAK